MYLDLNRAYKNIFLSWDYWQKCDAEISMLTPCQLYFGLMKSASDTNNLMDK